MRRKRVPQGVRGDVLRDAGPLHVAAEDLPRAHAGERTSARIEEENPLPLPFLESWPQLSQVHRGRADGGAADRHQTLLASLSEDAHQSFLEQEIAHPESDPLRDPQTGAVRE